LSQEIYAPVFTSPFLRITAGTQLRFPNQQEVWRCHDANGEAVRGEKERQVLYKTMCCQSVAFIPLLLGLSLLTYCGKQSASFPLVIQTGVHQYSTFRLQETFLWAE